MDRPPPIHRALLRLLLQVGVDRDLRRLPGLGVGGALAEAEPSQSQPSGTELLWLLVRLPVPHVSRLLPPGAAASPTTTTSTSNAPSLVDLTVHRLRRLPLPPADEQPVRAANIAPATRTALARSLFKCVVYLVLRRVRRLPPPRAALDSDRHHLVMTPATATRTTVLLLFIRRFSPPSAEAHADATTPVMGPPLRRPSHYLFRLLVIQALHRARQLALAFLASLWRTRQMVSALLPSLGGRGAVGALGFLILTNTRATRRLMAISHVLLRGRISRLQAIAVWLAFHISVLALGYFSSHGTEGGLVGRNEVQGENHTDEIPAGNSDSDHAMNYVLPVNEPGRPSALALLAFLLFQRRAQATTQFNSVPDQYLNVADSNKSPEEVHLMGCDTVSDTRADCNVSVDELYLKNGSSEELPVVKGDAADVVSDNGTVHTKGRIVISSFEEACQVINRWRDGKPEIDVEIASGTPSSTVKDIRSKFIKHAAGCLLVGGEAITDLMHDNRE